MKTKYAVISILFFITPLFIIAQQWGGSSTTLNNIYREGDISVHYNSSHRTTLGAAWGEQSIGYGTGYLGFNLARNNHSDGLWTYASDGSNNGGSVIYSNIMGDLLFSLKPTTGSSSGILDDTFIKNNIKFRINNDGKVVIGTAPEWSTSYMTWPGSYKLYVETGILTEKVRVALKTTANWADFVLGPSYSLMPLRDVKKFIQVNNHLPGIPSAKILVQTGLDLAEMQSMQMAKIEELTLYIIDLNEKIADLENRLSQIEK